MTHISDDLPPLDGLTALLAAADQGSFSGAAASLGLTHGSVSRRIASLEAWLGATVFERHGRGVKLTPAGQRFANEVRKSLGGLTRSAEQWRPRRGRQTVKMSVVPSFGRLWLLPRLSMIERADIHVELSLEHRPTDLDAREADIAIRYGAGSWDGMETFALFPETLFPVVSPNLLARLSGKPDTNELLEQSLLHDSDISQWRALLAQRGFSYRPRWKDRRFEDYDSVLIAADALGLNAAKMAVAGESSGGNIALAVSRLIAEAEEAPLAAQVLIYPAVDMRTDGPTWERFATGYLLTRARARFYLSQYLRNEADEDDPRASPLRASDPSIWPNTFILTASLDGTSGDAEAFAQRLRDAGVAVEHRRFEGWPHGFLFWGHREGGDAAITAAAHYLARALT